MMKFRFRKEREKEGRKRESIVRRRHNRKS